MTDLGLVPRSGQDHQGGLWLYEVVTPQYEVWPESLDHLEPAEWGCDCLMVYARNARRAKVLAVRAWRHANNGRYLNWPRARTWAIDAMSSPYLANADCDGYNPFVGIRACRLPSDDWCEENHP